MLGPPTTFYSKLDPFDDTAVTQTPSVHVYSSQLQPHRYLIFGPLYLALEMGLDLQNLFIYRYSETHVRLGYLANFIEPQLIALKGDTYE